MTDKFLLKLYDILMMNDVAYLKGKDKDQKEKISAVKGYLDKLEKNIKKISSNERAMNLIKKIYHEKYIIKEENIPDSYWEYLEKKYLEEGTGRYNLVNPETASDLAVRNEHVTKIIREQTESLDVWLDYLYSNDSNYLPIWAKVWAFLGMLKIGSYNKENNSYGRRGSTTVNPFVSLDSEMLGRSVELLKDYFDDVDISDEELAILVKSQSFQKIYGALLAKKKTIDTSNNEGIWVKYNCESYGVIKNKEYLGIEPEYMRLYNSLVGYNTGWCTASATGYAEEQLLGGDFYVYYTKDKHGKYKIPRIAIRMEGDSIKEIRGIAKYQNLEPDMEGILKEKLKEFSDGDIYYKKLADMDFLTKIHKKWKENKELTKEELRFIYEVDGKIIGFGFSSDQRIYEIIEKRDIKKDLAYVLDCSEDMIGISPDDLNRDLLYYRGNINEVFNNKMPKIVSGSVVLEHVTEIDDLILPEVINGSLILSGIESAKGLQLPRVIAGSFDLSGLKSMDGLVLPERVNGDINLSSITEMSNYIFPQDVDGNINLSSLVKVSNVIFPKYLYGELNLRNLKEMTNVTFPQYIGYNLILSNLANADNVVFPKNIGGFMDTSSVRSANGAILPDRIREYINFCCLESASGLTFPKEMSDSLNLAKITTLEGVILPEALYGNLNLSNIKSFNGRVLPIGIRKLFIDKLTDVDGIDEALANFDFSSSRIEHVAGYRIDSLDKLKEVILANKKKNSK